MLLHLVGIECGTVIGSPEKEEGSIQYRTEWCHPGNGVLDTACPKLGAHCRAWMAVVDTERWVIM